jgi:hypothetical protein
VKNGNVGAGLGRNHAVRYASHREANLMDLDQTLNKLISFLVKQI